MNGPATLGTPVIGSLCTGYAGLDLAVQAVLGGRLAWCADPDRHVQTITAARLPGVPNLGDITTVDFATVDAVDVLTAGFPCQDISSAGSRLGIEKGPRSGLWFRVADAVRALRPELLFVENVAALRYRGRGMDVVLGELAEAGYDTWWRCVRASDIGAPHRRERLFLLARPAGQAPAHTPGLRRPDRLHPAAPQSRVAPRAAHRRGHDPDLHPRLLRLSATQPATQPARAGCGGVIDWGGYQPALDRWAAVLGRPVPSPTRAGRTGRPRLNPPFVEWLMGLEAGWVSELPLARGAQLRALGNGVIPQQAAHALRLLLADAAEATATIAAQRWVHAA